MARELAGPSVRRALQDTIIFHWLRTAMAVLTAVVAAAIAFIVTGNPATWLAVLAAPIALVLAFAVLLGLNLAGWSRRWKATWWLDPTGERFCLRCRPTRR